MTRHYFLFQFAVGDDLTLTTTSEDDAREVLNFKSSGHTAHLTPLMETTSGVGVAVVPGVLLRVNWAHVVAMAYSAAEVAE